MKKWNQYVIVGLTGILLASPMRAFALTKNETIYTNLDEFGHITNSSVTNHLFIKKEKTFEDETELKEILNINGLEKFELNQNQLIWDANGKDIFYRGKIEKEQPIEVEIEYYLNGEKKKPKEMLGKKGNVKMVFQFQNKQKNKVTVGGKEEYIYTPFVVTSGMILDNRYNSNIEVINGKWVDSGSRSMVIGIATPGLYESLNIEELKSLNTITVSYDTTKFTLGNIYMVATPKILEEKDLKVFKKMDSLTSNVEQLQTSMNQIEEGAKQLESGSLSLLNGTNELSNNLKLALNSVTQLKNGSLTLKQGLSDTILALAQVKSSLQNKNVTGSIASLNELKIANTKAITTLLGKAGMDYDTLKAFYDGNQLQNYTGTEESLLNAKTTYELVSLLAFNNNAIDKTITSLTEILESVNTLMTTLEGALGQLQSGSETLSNGLIALENGISELSNGAVLVAQGSSQLNEGIVTLSNGISTFNKEGINPLYEYSKKAKYYGNKLEALGNLSKEYNGYATNNADNTMFVYMIKSVK